MLKEILIYFSMFLGIFVLIFYMLSYRKRIVYKRAFNKNNLPFVSIIVPAWNEEEGIGPTIESLRELDYPKDKFEILVVDDGSKDKTYERAKVYENDLVKIFKKEENGGKFTALNYGIEKARGEIVFSCDADKLRVSKNALIDMVQPFKDERVVCVAPSMALNDSKKILVRVQQIEYLLGVFLRNALASVDAMSVTPGAFSAYRKSFIEKYGGFRKAHLTEDMEMCLRAQYHNYKIASVPEAIVLTEAPYKFKPLLKQRRRWYVGQFLNLYDYRKMFSKSYGALGMLGLPLSIGTVFLSLIISFLIMFSTVRRLIQKIGLLESIKFNIFHSINVSQFMIEKSIFKSLTDPIFVLSIIFFMTLIGYLIFAKKFVKQTNGLALSLIEFTIIYPFLFFVWWTDAIIHTTILKKKVKWR